MLTGLRQLDRSGVQRELRREGVLVLLCCDLAQAASQVMASILEQIGGVSPGKARFGIMDSGSDPVGAEQWLVRETPTILVFIDGGLVDRLEGPLPGPEIAERLDLVFRVIARARHTV